MLCTLTCLRSALSLDCMVRTGLQSLLCLVGIAGMQFGRHSALSRVRMQCS